jgi:hypothetical protein
MFYLEVAGRVLLAVVFGVACAGKVSSPAAFAGFARSLSDLGWLTGRRRIAAVAALIPASEAAVTVLLAVPATVAWGFATATVLLGTLTAGAGIAIRRGRRVECRCFGASAQPMGAPAMIRNAILIAVAVAGLGACLAAPGGAGSPLALTVTAGLACLAGLMMVGWDELGYLLRSRPA